MAFFINKKNRGFTLIEIVVAIFFSSIFIFLAAEMAISFFQKPKQQMDLMDVADRARIISFGFTNEIRNATTGEGGGFSIGKADRNEVVFFSKINPDDYAKRVRYFISEDKLYRGVIDGQPGYPFYDLAEEKIQFLIQLASDSNSSFNYFDGDYDGARAELAQPVNINHIKFIRVYLEVESKSSGRIFPVVAGASVRGLKNNLGN